MLISSHFKDISVFRQWRLKSCDILHLVKWHLPSSLYNHPWSPFWNISCSGNSFVLRLARIVQIIMQIVVDEGDEVTKKDYCGEFLETSFSAAHGLCFSRNKFLNFSTWDLSNIVSEFLFSDSVFMALQFELLYTIIFLCNSRLCLHISFGLFSSLSHASPHCFPPHSSAFLYTFRCVNHTFWGSHHTICMQRLSVGSIAFLFKMLRF